MSHFPVIVIGDNIESQLQPYHEYECTGIDDEYVVDVDVTDKAKKEFEESDGSDFHEFCKDWYGCGVIMRDDKVFIKTNPNAKWDWWVVGGRWADLFNITEGQRKDFDFLATKEKRKVEAEGYFDKLTAITDGIEPPENTWKQLVDIYKDNIEEARSIRQNHPWIKAIAADEDLRWRRDDEVEIFTKGRDKYVQGEVERSCSPYAIVKNSEWHAKGKMGWFGISDDQKTQGDWNKTVNDMIIIGRGDERLTVVDCHI